MVVIRFKNITNQTPSQLLIARELMQWNFHSSQFNLISMALVTSDPLVNKSLLHSASLMFYGSSTNFFFLSGFPFNLTNNPLSNRSAHTFENILASVEVNQNWALTCLVCACLCYSSHSTETLRHRPCAQFVQNELCTRLHPTQPGSNTNSQNSVPKRKMDQIHRRSVHLTRAHNQLLLHLQAFACFSPSISVLIPQSCLPLPSFSPLVFFFFLWALPWLNLVMTLSYPDHANVCLAWLTPPIVIPSAVGIVSSTFTSWKPVFDHVWPMTCIKFSFQLSSSPQSDLPSTQVWQVTLVVKVVPANVAMAILELHAIV